MEWKLLGNADQSDGVEGQKGQKKWQIRAERPEAVKSS